MMTKVSKGVRKVHNPRFYPLGDGREIIIGFDKVLGDDIRSTPVEKYIKDDYGVTTSAVTRSGSVYTFTYDEEYNKYQDID